MIYPNFSTFFFTFLHYFCKNIPTSAHTADSLNDYERIVGLHPDAAETPDNPSNLLFSKFNHL